MPGMDGVEFLRHLADRDHKAGIILVSGEDPRILHTARSLAASHQLYVLGAILKPIKPAPLMALLRDFDPHRTTLFAPTSGYNLTEEEVVEGLKTGDALELVYQPKVAVTEARVLGVEALARWRHPQHGILGPAAFIPLAEEKGHIDALTELVFTKAMAQGGDWRAEGLDLGISVNYSVDSLGCLELPDWIVATSEAQGMDPHRVTLEVTETRMMQDLRTPLEILTRLRLRGVGLPIDDFGTGHSSMAQVQRILFTELKIDRAFVFGAAQDKAARAILESSIALGNSLDLFLVAEGVETQQDWDLITSLGCNCVQGYYVSKPIPGAEIDEFTRAWERNPRSVMAMVNIVTGSATSVKGSSGLVQPQPFPTLALFPCAAFMLFVEY